ncbi:hypothetical protein N7519_003929 [Penicillium mononematosum]|uniref:uncharacterized protein n=1 Tax=Penicillium mononematosum TaxID=268346 RepID=UPI00254738EB|nr:uncharacterized protein N7519_003929 [Penicillium mononematosum]KAJ6189021.1 hypothetical protein N7519_003929 [Penicillium mononematosum]
MTSFDEPIPNKGRSAVDLLSAIRPQCTLLRGTPEYENARKGYWAAEQARCTPYCIFQPTNSEDVAQAVHVLRETGCPFGIKSGGHGRCEGESSITAGVLIDLKPLDDIRLSDDKTSCRVGPGNTWANVYGTLNPQGLTVIGGRASTVGVGGFCVSGGISFFSNRHGWALDNIHSFEVVLADSRIVTASPSSNPDLYKALRGGGANFGIVTSFDLMVHPYQGMWGGGINWAWEHGDAIIDAFIEYGNDNLHNVDSSLLIGVINYDGTWVWHADIEHLLPTSAHKNPTLKRLLDIPAVSDFTGPTSQIQRTDGILDHYPPGCYNGYWTFCTKVDKRLIKVFIETWRDEIDPILHIEGIEKSALADINFVSGNIINAMRRNGGNALGVVEQGPFLVFLMEPFWIKEADSPTVWKAMETTATRTQNEAKRLGLHHEYIYLNYANPFQDVYDGYGEKAKRFLIEVSRKYDPEGFFQAQRGTGWDLRGPLVPSSRI